MKEAIEEYKKEYQQNMKDIKRQEQEKGTFRRGELPERFIAKRLFGWSDKKYNKEYQGKLKRNWR